MTKDVNISLFDRRLVIVSRCLGIVTMIIGLGAIISQLAKMSPFLESYPGWDCDWGNIITIAIGGVLVFISSGKRMKIFLKKSLLLHPEKTQKILSNFPWVVAVLVVILKLTIGQTKSYRAILDEGGLIEYSTCIAYFLAAVFAYLIARHFRQNRQKILGYGYLFYSSFFLIIWGEEVSWGQRTVEWAFEALFGWKLPDFWGKYNRQGEWNFHNLVWVHDYTGEASIVVGVLALVGMAFSVWYFKDKTEKVQEISKYLLPDKFLASFFIFTIVLLSICEYCSVYCPATDSFRVIIPADREIAEWMLSLGFMLFALANYFRQALVEKKNLESQLILN